MARGQTVEESHQWHHQLLPFCTDIAISQIQRWCPIPLPGIWAAFDDLSTRTRENEVPDHPRVGHKKPGSFCLGTCVLGTFSLGVLTMR